jgi:uncharacterized phage protein (TIGR02218 family)
MTLLTEHLKTGLTHVCRCWAIVRSDGLSFGFTDHDMPLTFDGITFVAHSGMSAKALASTSGLSVNNTEAVGILTDAAITEDDIAAGRYDDADVTVWMVQWDQTDARKVLFRGKIGEITRTGGAFQADLRGLTDLLNQPQGRSYLKTCSAVLGDGKCGVALSLGDFSTQAVLDRETDGQFFDLAAGDYDDGWFVNGSLEVLTGSAAGLKGAIKHDQVVASQREITLWAPLRLLISVGDTIQISAGCDKLSDTCQSKFNNINDFQGFPHIPGEDWLMSVPRSSDANSGGSLT